MLPQWFSSLLLWVLALAVAGVYSQSENDFEDSPDVKKVPMRAFTLSPPYLDSDMGNRWFDFGGDTVIRTDRFIRLTADRASQRGWMFSRVPLAATNWQIELEFNIHGEKNLYGDGFAMWLTKDRATPGPVFGHKDNFEGLGIFFDTYKNGRAGMSFPIVMAMMGDGKTQYDQARDGKATELASCSARGIRGASVPTKARLTYFQDQSLSLDLQYKSDNGWTACFSVTPGPERQIKMPSVAYLGFSAETGELHDNHDIVNVNAFSLYQQNKGNKASGRGDTARQQKGSSSKKKQQSSGTWLGFFFKTFLFIGAIVAAYAGYTLYRTNRRGRF